MRGAGEPDQGGGPRAAGPPGPARPSAPDERGVDPVFTALLEDSVEELYDNAPCGYLSTLLDGTIAKVNDTLLSWLGYRREQLLGRRSFQDLLTVGGRLYHETHFAPLLRMQGEVNGIALELVAADGKRLPVFVTATLKTGKDGRPLLIRASVFDARDRRAYERELLRERREAEQARHDAERERRRLQEVLAVLQRSLLPPSLPRVPGVECAAHYHTASPDNLGGDFYDLFPLGGGQWGFFLGDVCGKGPAAAAVTSLIRYTLRTAAVHEADPAAVLTSLNNALLGQYAGSDTRFCTVAFGVLAPEREGITVRHASGGHPPLLVLRADGTAEYRHTPGGMLVGAVPGASFTRVTTRLLPGDTLLLYTDGLTEARVAPGAARYGEQALQAFATALAPTTARVAVDAITGLLDRFGKGLGDDAAVLALSVPARPVRTGPEAVTGHSHPA